MNALSKVRAHSWAALLLAAVLLPGAALAQVPDRVGRIAYLSGDVQFYSEAEQAWLPAQLNAPVSSRNSLFTGPGSRAEIRFGGTAVALDGQTQLDIQVLDDTSFKAGVPRGSVNLRVRQIESDESYEVTAPAANYALLQEGRYRVDAGESGSSIAVLAGLADASVDGGGAVTVEAGQALSAANGGFVRNAARSSALDSWAAQRDNAYSSSQSARYVSPNMTGYEELDANGRWSSDPDYGNVWYPTTHVNPGWVPYRDGHWAFVAPWGWTWIDDAPWGFAPFHYGRWVFVGSRWGWTPGAYVRRPSYAPALVGFIGGSTAVSISIGTQPAVGWYPLPPWERYRPGYRHHDRHERNINNFNTNNPPAHAWRTVENRRVSANQVQGATVVPREAFVGSRPVRRSTMTVAAPVLTAPHVVSAPLVAPTRSARGSPSAGGRPEFGDRRGSREPLPAPGPAIMQPLPSVQTTSPESRRGGFRDENRGGERQAQPAVPQGREAVQAPGPAIMQPLPSVQTTSPESRRGGFRDENRGGERQAQPAAVPQGREAVQAPAPAIMQPLPSVQTTSPESRRGGFRGENRGGERQAPPAAVPQGREAVPVPAPAIMQPPPSVQTTSPESRRGGFRGEDRAIERPAPQPAVVVPPVVRPEPRVEPRAVQRIEPRLEPRPEPPRQVQRVEPPPQVRMPAAQPAPPPPQPAAKPAPTPEQERERRHRGERGKD